MEPYFTLNSDGSINIILCLDAAGVAFASDFFPGVLRKFPAKYAELRRVALVRGVKIIISSALVLSIPLTSINSAAVSRYAMSYIYFGSAEAQIQYVHEARNTLNCVSPAYFTIDRGGNLSIAGISGDFIAAMRAAGIRIAPFLSNHWDRQAGVNALNNPRNLAAQVNDAVRKYGFDGVNIDIENVTEREREKYVEFVRILRELLPEGSEVSVAVAANPGGFSTGWHGSYDYEKLARYADYLYLMTYDEHYENGPEGPVAGIDFVENSIKYALRHVPTEKIVLGIPFFGRVWSPDGRVKGAGVSLKTVTDFEKRYDTTVTFDEKSKSPVMTLTVKPSDTPPVVLGQTLWAGTYRIYYENADSIREKLSLVGKYDLRGAGNWSAGQENPDIWDYYGIWLHGGHFTDISGCFARDAIIDLSENGIMLGMTDSAFEPNTLLTRAQAAAVCRRALGLAYVSDSVPFDDVRGHWAEGEIASAVAAGIFQGYPNGTFRPDEPVTRAEMSVILARMIECSYAELYGPFPDVPPGHWAEHEIAALARLGILGGYTDGLFRPDRSLTRGETAALLARIMPLL